MDESHFHMADVVQKPVTFRRAEAQGRIRMSAEAFQLVRERRLPKGDALVLAEVAGIQATKRTADLLPLCHPLPVEHARVSCELEDEGYAVLVRCLVATSHKTGVEMEALTGATGALLCLYDLIKPVDPALEISAIRLNFKEGGKRGLWWHPLAERKTGSSCP